jgi:hypothetical protein
MRLHLRVLQLLLLLRNLGAQTGNGITTDCIQQTLCQAGCVNTAANGTCYQCGIAWYKPTTGSTACLACPVNSGLRCSICTISCQCNPGFTGPDGGPCLSCAAGTYKIGTGNDTCTNCGSGKYSSTSGATSAATCVQCPSEQTSPNASSSIINCICPAGTVPFKDPLETILKVNPAYISTSAEAWDSVNNRFRDVSMNVSHGGLTAGTVTVGTVTGNGASGSIPFVGGTTTTKILWPVGSIPSTFTVCSLTRYTGATSGRILDCVGLNWLHGHWSAYAGSTYYNGPGNLNYGISPNTDWVVVCGRNIGTAGAISTIVNDVVSSTAAGGTGNCQLIINQGELST